MRTPLVLATAAVLAVALVEASPAATRPTRKLPPAKPLVIVDPSGDANALNGQGQTSAVPSRSTPPAQHAAADIVKVTLTRLDDTKAVKGLKIAMTLAAAPARASSYSVAFAIAGCDRNELTYLVDHLAQGYTGRYQSCADGAGNRPIAPAKVTGTTIEWNVLFKDVPAGPLKLGTQLTAITPQTRAAIGNAPDQVVRIPLLDETAPAGPYKVGQ